MYFLLQPTVSAARIGTNITTHWNPLISSLTMESVCTDLRWLWTESVPRIIVTSWQIPVIWSVNWISKKELSIGVSTSTHPDKPIIRYFSEYLNSKGSDPTHAFYNGLTSFNGSWWWDQPNGMPMWPLSPYSGAAPQRAGCVADMKYSDGTYSWTPISCTNLFRFLCESVACDTDNYCEF